MAQNPSNDFHLPEIHLEDKELLHSHTHEKSIRLPQYPVHQGRPVLIYFGDMVHNFIGKGPFTIPLNVGYLAAYARKILGPKIEFKIFKFPEELIEAIRTQSPDILALSNYTWNVNLGTRLLQKFKKESPKILTIMGGPNLDHIPEAYAAFLQERPFLDLYVRLQGEAGFVEAVHRFIQSGFDLKKLKSSPVLGCEFFDFERSRPVSGPHIQLNDLDEIPSPYLTGVLDPFFNGTLNPILESNRGCPYSCTFCAWGNAALQRVNKFSLERIGKELEYIARKCADSPIDDLYFGDANFGMFSDRDWEIARMLRDNNQKHGYPKYLHAGWAKNKTEKNLAIAEVLGDISPVTVSFQTMNDTSLEYIKRSNMKVEHFKKIQDYFKNKGLMSKAELIVGLPGETKASHLEALSILLEEGNCIINPYNCMLLRGSEMNEKSYRERHGLKSGWRLLDNGFGKYGEVCAIEGEEIVLGTNVMSKEDILYFRPLHWLIFFLRSYGYYSKLLAFFKSQNVPIIDFFTALLDNYPTAAPSVIKIFDEFEKETFGEYFETETALVGHYQRPENWEMLAKGGFGKMNMKYSFRVLIECKNEFSDYIASVAGKLFERKNNGKTLGKIAEEIVRFETMSAINFTLDNPFEPFSKEFLFDVVQWEKKGWPSNVMEYYLTTPVLYAFSISTEQKTALENRLKIYEGASLNLKLRKMTEVIKPSDLKFRAHDGRLSKKSS